MNNSFSSKLPETAVSIFSQMTALSNAHGAVNLSQGFPDFPADPELINLVTEYMQQGFNQYAPMPGIMELRQAIANKLEYLYRVQVNPETEITITSGGTQALFTAIGTVVQPGDEVIIFEPAYDSYKPSVELFGGKVIPVRLQTPIFQIDWDEVESLISEKTRLIIINNPNNPTATVLAQEDLLALERLVVDRNIYVLSDEVYEHIIYDERVHQSVIQYPGLRERSFLVASFGKLLHTTGWKLGYIIAPPFLTTEFRKIHQFNVFSSNTPMQYAVARYLEQQGRYLNLSSFFEKKRDLLVMGLQETRFNILPSQGTYFLLVDYSNISDQDELSFAQYITREHRVAMVPVSAFYSKVYNQQLLRICFAKKEATLVSAIQHLKEL
ncbi:aminotransferase class I/II-fold pyridoxal phosphate-dependent enzyme [Sphingobacterium olei]|uniref:Aminotransferase class I/II-fold pyridoxal phosphate-dependent enzyme n=1 Tax=Sphingobacterium olei TaxID=2571155 RepID=A0A4U0PB13_9SPHI|nr:methionine aminotransferase [Sphingobacterium olei]TJZ59854.1 aminotransferase class I/II-fold pyridoxal phosphate-dependent enzyme [Sphingobacterium olei]